MISLADHHQEQWDAFVKSHPNPVALAEERKIVMFRHGWKNPDRNVDEFQEALHEWQKQIMAESKP